MYLRPATTRKSISALPNLLAAAQVYQPPWSSRSGESMRIPCSDEIGSLLKYQAIVSLALVVLQVSQTACPISPYSMLLLVELTTGAAPEQVNNCYYSSPTTYKTAK